MTRGQLLDQICTLYGGREAELLFFDDLSIGSSADIDRATDIARALVEQFGMGGELIGARRVEQGEHDPLSETLKAAMEKAVRDILQEQQGRSRRILEENKLLVQTLRDLLIEKKVLDKEALANILPADEQEGRRRGREPGELTHGHLDPPSRDRSPHQEEERAGEARQ